MGDWRIQVLTGGDTLRQERLTRDLLEHLRTSDGVTAGFDERPDLPAPGAKGGLAGDMALWAAVAAAGQVSGRVLVTLIKEWSARERNRKVELTTRDGASLTITGRPDEAQERLVREFVSGGNEAE